MRQDDFAGEGRGGGFAVRAGDRDDGAGQKLGGQFKFADDRFADDARLHQLRRIEGHARANHDQILIAEGAVAVAAGFDRDAVLEEQENPLRSSASGFESETVTRAPRDFRKRAEATPDLPRPTTRTRLSLRSIGFS